ncbi:MAG: biotin/lipoyl-containing protein [Candidatus Thermoplasmatota archaeon]
MFLKYEHDGHVYNVEVEQEDENYFVTYDEKTYTLTAEEIKPGHLKIKLGEEFIKSIVSEEGDKKFVFVDGDVFEVKPVELSGVKERGKEDGDLKSPISGEVVDVKVEENDRVKEGDVLMVIEAMKMEYLIKAPYNGEVLSVNYEENEQIDIGEETLELEKEEKGEEKEE